MKSALHYCVENSNPASAELVLAAAPELLDAPDQEGFTPLHLAVIAGNVGLVRFLLHRRADLTAVDNEKHSVVHWATGKNYRPVFKIKFIVLSSIIFSLF
jgi:ankyrin repeat protein